MYTYITYMNHWKHKLRLGDAGESFESYIDSKNTRSYR